MSKLQHTQFLYNEGVHSNNQFYFITTTNKQKNVSSPNTLKCRSYSTTSLPMGVLSRIQHANKVTFIAEKLKGKQLDENEDADVDTTEDDETDRLYTMRQSKLAKCQAQPPSSSSKPAPPPKPAPPRHLPSSDYDSCNESPSGSVLTINDGSTNTKCCPLCGGSTTPTTMSTNLVGGNHSKRNSIRWPFIDLPPPLTPNLNSNGHYIIGDVCYDLDDINQNLLLQRINEWDYPIFELYDMIGDTILSKMAYYVFNETGIMDSFRIPISEFLHYFHALECGYRHKPCK